jgi:hypothetical protein
MGMMALVGLFIVLSALHRVNIIKFDTKGTFGSACLVSAVIAVVILAMDRTSYLPFLGESVFPTSLLALQAPRDATFSVNVKVKPGASHVVYWAAESGVGLVPNPFDAYGNYTNAGVVKASPTGDAVLPIRCPAQYKVSSGKTLPRHVHYRALYPSGIAGDVKTTQVTCL